MSNFVATLNDSNNSFSLSANGVIMSFIDYSNYNTNTESGHTQTDFSDFRVIRLKKPDNTYRVFSSLGTGDQITIIPKGATLPIQDIWSNYTSGDGVYEINLFVLPTYNAAATYTSLSQHCVYYLGNLYQCKVSSSHGVLPTNTSNWTLLSSYDSLPSKYNFNKKFAVLCDSQSCYVNMLSNALCEQSEIGCNFKKLFSNRSYMAANKMLLILSKIGILVDIQDWNAVTNEINYLRAICCCNS